MPNRNILIFLSAILAGISAPPFSLSPLILTTFAPLFYFSYTARSSKVAANYGLIFGATYMSVYHFWLMSLKPFAPLPALIVVWILYSVYLGVFYSIPSAIVRWLSPTIPLWISAPCTFTTFEYLRQIGPIGNPGGGAGYAVISLPPLANVAAVGGIFLVSYFIFTLNALIAATIISQGRKKIAISFLAFFIVGIWLGSGQFLEYKYQRERSDNTQPIAIIQGNHPQMDKFSSSLWNQIKSDYLYLSKSQKEHIVIWPETITPTLNLDDRIFVSSIQEIAKQNNQTIIFGTPYKKNDQFYNSAIAITPVPTSTNYVYSKNKLMPFGEYWPFKSYLSKLGLSHLIGADYSRSNDQHPIVLNDNQKVGLAICLESMYPEFLRQQTLNGANLLVVLANNAWFFDSSAAEKHFQMTQMRAIENQRWVCLASNTGISTFINPMGKPTKMAPRDTQTKISEIISIEIIRTAYTQYGNWIIVASILITILSAGINQIIRLKTRQTK